MLIFSESHNKKLLLAEGGEGRIYTYKSDYILKIFKDEVDKTEKLAKIQILMNKVLPSNVVKPLELVYNANQEFIGYLMQKVKGEEMHYLSSRKFVKANNITKKGIIQMLVSISNTLADLHQQQIYIGDLSDRNILFDDQYNVYFIDVDSWCVDKYLCSVANDAFKDPQLQQNRFNANTDIYAFAILVYKTLTRLHPFGGMLKSNEDMSLEERMKQGLSVIRNTDVVIPKMTDPDVFMPNKLIGILADIFTNTKRVMFQTELTDFYNHLQLCPTHDDYYYALFNKCPVCVIGSTEVPALTKIGTVGGIPIFVVFSDSNVKIIFDERVYLTKDNRIRFRNAECSCIYEKGLRYDVNDDGHVVYQIDRDNIVIQTPEKTFQIEKKYHTHVITRNNDVYYISDNLILTKFGLLNTTTSFSTQIEEVSINHVFNVYDTETYCVCNCYDHKKIVSVSGYMYPIENKAKMLNSALHYDPITKTWLLIFETNGNNFTTVILEKKRGILAIRDDVHYFGQLGNISYHNGFIYLPKDGKIVRFNYQTNEFKEFNAEVVSNRTKLIKKPNKFTAVNDSAIYEIG